jgi:hypothetical protein
MYFSRRQFFTLCGAAAAAPIFGQSPDKASLDPDLVVLFSDTHLPGRIPGAHQLDAMQIAVRQVLAMRPLPANLLVLGDFCHLYGYPEDYAVCRKQIQPLKDAGIAVSLAMGNHDRHETFFAEFPEYLALSKVKKGADPMFASCPDGYRRMVSVVETPNADIILLDSCLDGPVPGAIDDAQRAWLAKTLKACRKPVLVASHHPINETKLGEALSASPTCAGYIHGHDHRWRETEFDERLPILCLPSVGHWGDIGFCTMRLNERGALVQARIRAFWPFNGKPLTKEELATPGGQFLAQAESMVAKSKDGSTWRVAWKHA